MLQNVFVELRGLVVVKERDEKFLPKLVEIHFAFELRLLSEHSHAAHELLIVLVGIGNEFVLGADSEYAQKLYILLTSLKAVLVHSLLDFGEEAYHLPGDKPINLRTLLRIEDRFDDILYAGTALLIYVAV